MFRKLRKFQKVFMMIKVSKVIKSLLCKEVMMFRCFPPELSDRDIIEVFLALARAVTT